MSRHTFQLPYKIDIKNNKIKTVGDFKRGKTNYLGRLTIFQQFADNSFRTYIRINHHGQKMHTVSCERMNNYGSVPKNESIS